MKPTQNLRRTDCAKVLAAEFGARRYRITRNGDIYVYDTMPNTNQVGWYLFGSVDCAYTLVRLGINV
jgi:hypothetical protein